MCINSFDVGDVQEQKLHKRTATKREIQNAKLTAMQTNPSVTRNACKLWDTGKFIVRVMCCNVYIFRMIYYQFIDFHYFIEHSINLLKTHKLIEIQ